MDLLWNGTFEEVVGTLDSRDDEIKVLLRRRPDLGGKARKRPVDPERVKLKERYRKRVSVQLKDLVSLGMLESTNLPPANYWPGTPQVVRISPLLAEFVPELALSCYRESEKLLRKKSETQAELHSIRTESRRKQLRMELIGLCFEPKTEEHLVFTKLVAHPLFRFSNPALQDREEIRAREILGHSMSKILIRLAVTLWTKRIYGAQTAWYVYSACRIYHPDGELT